ncbi:hypothetical protein AAK967_01010 [Atopobiaceae bacterium 24-176]
MFQRSWAAFVVVVGLLFVVASAAMAPEGTTDATLLTGGLAVATVGAVCMVRRGRTGERSGA